MKEIKTLKQTRKLLGKVSLFFLGLTVCLFCVITSSSAAVINIDPSKTTTTTEKTEKLLDCKHEARNMSKLYMGEHSLEKSQLEETSETGLEPDFWVLNGNTTIENGEVVRLFPLGSLWNSVPVEMENWEIQLQIGFQGEKQENGLGFWYTRFIMPPSGSKSRSEGLLILIQRNEHGITGSASISPESKTENDSMNETMSIMVNDRTGENFIDYDWQLSGCSAPLSENGNKTWLKIRYENHHLSVSTKPEDDEKDQWVNCFMQKEEEELYLPTSYYFGFSSVLENEEDENEYLDIYQVKTFELIPLHNPECLEDDEEISQTPSDDELPLNMPPPVYNQEEIEVEFHGKGRTMSEMVFPFKVLWVPLVGFFVIIAFCVMGMYVYANEPENLPTRFY